MKPYTGDAEADTSGQALAGASQEGPARVEGGGCDRGAARIRAYWVGV